MDHWVKHQMSAHLGHLGQCQLGQDALSIPLGLTSTQPHLIFNHLHIWLRYFHSSQFLNLFFFFYFMATSVEYGSSQARGRIGAASAGPHHSHSNAGPKPHQILNPLNKARDQTHILTGTMSGP